jgi:hypothetical protein
LSPAEVSLPELSLAELSGHQYLHMMFGSRSLLGAGLIRRVLGRKV